MGKWLKRLSIAALVGFPIAVLAVRFGLLGFKSGINIVLVSVLLAAAVFLLGMLVSFVQRNSNPESAKAGRFAAFIALIPLIGIGSQAFVGSSLPMIHNVSTNTASPPSFDKIIELRGEGANPHEYDASKIKDLQVNAYPNVKTLYVDDSVQDAYAKSLALVEELGWELVHANDNAGVIEATDTTALWGFKDDIVIRVDFVGVTTSVDLRSVSRVGKSDLGANAKRIEKFLAAYPK